jgi:serine protease Do
MKRLAYLLAVSLAVVLAVRPTASPSSEGMTETSTRAVLDVRAVKLIECGSATGSGALIAKGKLLTAAHVVRNGACSVDGKPAKVLTQDEAGDWAVLGVDIKGPRLKVSCMGFRQGSYYLAGGYAFGARLMLHGLKYDGGRGAISEQVDGVLKVRGDDFPLLNGLAFPGMSGGPVVDLEGHLIGIVNGSNVMNAPHPLAASALFRPLRETALCRR